MNNPLHIETPLWESDALSKLTGKKVYLKMDAFQPTGSFKVRGIGRLCQESVSKRGIRHLVSASGGNAGHATAYMGKMLGVKVTVFVPETTRELMKERIRSYGAEIKIYGKTFCESGEGARAFVASTKDAEYISPYDHPTIWEGHASLMDEVAKQMGRPDTVLVSVGGGGLMCGLLIGMERQGWKDVRVIGVEPAGAPKLVESMKQGKVVTLPNIKTIITSLAGKTIAQGLLDRLKTQECYGEAVEDRESVLATKRFLDDHRVLVEPSCGTCLSLAYNKHQLLDHGDKLLIIICGGTAINYEILKELSERFGV